MRNDPKYTVVALFNETVNFKSSKNLKAKYGVFDREAKVVIRTSVHEGDAIHIAMCLNLWMKNLRKEMEIEEQKNDG
jgi:hypothetical protein